MKNKIFTLIGMSVFIVVLALSLVSALTLSISGSPSTLSGSSNSTSFTIISSEQVNFVDSLPFISTIKDSDNKAVSIIVTNISRINGVTSASFQVNASSIPRNFNLGIYTSNVRFNAVSSINNSLSSFIDVPISFLGSYCELGEQGQNISIRQVKDKELDNTDFWKWRPLDNIEVNVQVENNGNDRIKDGIIKYGIFDQKDNNFIFEDEVKFNLKSNDNNDYPLNFEVNPNDLNSDTGDNDYLFVVKAYDDNAGEDRQCKQYIQDLEIARNNDEVTIDPKEVKIDPQPATCNGEVELTGKAYNIGSSDQSDVKVTLFNSDLGIRQNYTIGSLDVGNSEGFRFPITVPEDAIDKSYSLKLSILDENDDVYQIQNHDGDDEDAIFTIPFTVSGCAVLQQPKATITAKLESGGKAGEDLIVKSTIFNTGTRSQTYVIKASDYDTWATLNGIEPGVIVLNAGQSKDVSISLKVNSDVSGDQTFNIEAATSDTQAITQPVSVTIEKSSSFSFPGFSGGSLFNKDNWYLWAIGIINLILVIVIIVVAVKIARK